MEINKVKSKKKTVLIYIIFLAILALSSIALTITTTTKGAEIAYLEKQRQASRLEMEELSSKAVTSTSLSQISSLSEELGLIKPDQVIYLNHPETVASLR